MRSFGRTTCPTPTRAAIIRPSMRNARLSSVRAWIWPVRDTGSPSEPALVVTVRTGRTSAAGCGLSQAASRTKPRQATTAADLISYLILAGGYRHHVTKSFRAYRYGAQQIAVQTIRLQTTSRYIIGSPSRKSLHLRRRSLSHETLRQYEI